ncbi:MAG TPA: EAL domain-containing protein [Acetobacteraceae bacterium]
MKHLSFASRRLLAAGASLLLLLPVALGLMIWQLHRDDLAEARQNVSTLGLAIAEQTTRSLQAGDLVLEELRRQIAGLRLETVEDFKAKLGNEDLFKFLKDRADFLPQIDAFTIIAADGKLVNFSRQWPAPSTDLSDRDYFAWFRDNDVPDAFVSKPVQNRGSGAWTVYIVRRLNAPSGQFIGMILAAVDLDYFKEFFKALTTGAGTTVTLLRNDGTALTSYPPTARIGNVLPAASPWHQIVKQGPEVFVTEGVLAPGTRIVSVHPLKDYPLVINVSVSEWVALAAWIQTSAAATLCAFMAIACVGLLLRALLRQFRRLEASETMLANRNAALEATRRRLETQAGELSASRALMAEQSATLQIALTHMNQGIMMVAADGMVAVCNKRAAEMLDLPQDLVESRPSFVSLVAYQRSRGEFGNSPTNPCAFSFEEAMAGPGHYERERPNGRMLEVETVPVPGGGLVRTFTDVTERRHSEMQVQFMARHDGLTGLLNRTAFQDRLQALLKDAAGNGHHLAVFYMDLDGFKLVNDTHGHAAGDELLVAVAGRLRSSLRETDVVARMGGDEFAVIQSPSRVGGGGAELAARMLAAVSEPFPLAAGRCTVGISIGVAIYPDHSVNGAELLRNADTALYQAKASGKRTFCIWDPALDGGQQSLFLLEQDLAHALQEKQFFLEYQPIVDTGTLDVVRFEALLRWNHPTRGVIGPGDFIAIAERCGLIVPIGQWVIEAACTAAAAWPWPVEVSINLSPVQFTRGSLATQVEQILQRTGLHPARLNLEVTEGVLLESTGQVLQAMSRLRQLGVRFSLDDFGTAHAGLTYLRRFTFDVLKVDKSFVQDAARSPDARIVLGAIQAIGAACNLQVVAEGVETAAELAVVRDLRCAHVQGYLTGRPNKTVTLDNTGEALPALRSRRLSLVQRS